MFFTLQFSQKPFGDPWYNKKHKQKKNNKRNDQVHPESLTQASVTLSHYCSQDNKDSCISKDGSTYRYCHGLVPGDTQFAYDRIGYQSMCCKHTRDENAGIKFISQNIPANRKTNGQWKNESKETKKDTFEPVTFEF